MQMTSIDVAGSLIIFFWVSEPAGGKALGWMEAKCCREDMGKARVSSRTGG